jgi:hypothetical protein
MNTYKHRLILKKDDMINISTFGNNEIPEGWEIIGVQVACDILDKHGLDICTGDIIRVTNYMGLNSTGIVYIRNGISTVDILGTHPMIHSMANDKMYSVEIIDNIWGYAK